MANDRHNHLGQPIGEPLPDWSPRPPPPATTMSGRFCRLEALRPDAHAHELFDAYALDEDHAGWTYLAHGPFATFDEYRDWLTAHCTGRDPLFFAIVDAVSERAVGAASYMRIKREIGVIEVGSIHYSPLLQKTPAGTEAMYLMLERAFDELGYRRYEWKCDALNASSRAAARRLGFTFEGVFRQAIMYKARNRDTAWFSIIDTQWPRLKRAYQAWLAPANFDSKGRQRQSLACHAEDSTRAE